MSNTCQHEKPVCRYPLGAVLPFSLRMGCAAIVAVGCGLGCGPSVVGPDSSGAAVERDLKRLALARASADAGDFDDELQVYTEVYASGAEGLQGMALTWIADAFRNRWDWERLDGTLGILQARQDEISAEVLDLRFRSHLGNRDLHAALATVEEAQALGLMHPSIELMSPLVTALANATPSEHMATSASTLDLDGDGVDEVVLFQLGTDPLEDYEPIVLAGSEAGLPALAKPLLPDLSYRPQAAFAVRFPAGPDALVVQTDSFGGERTLRLWSWTSESWVERYAWTETSLATAAVAADPSGKEGGLYVGTGAYSRTLYRVTQGDQPSHHNARLDQGSQRSDIAGIVVADLNGDDVAEVHVAYGPWDTYGVQQLEPDDSGLLAVRHQHQLGTLVALERLQHSDGRVVLAAAKVDEHPSAQVFGPEEPAGAPSGIYLLGLSEDGYEQVRFLAAPHLRSAAEPQPITDLFVADLDGDGREDLIAQTTDAQERPHALFYRQLDDGAFAMAVVGGLRVLTTAQLDDDPASELLVTLSSSKQSAPAKVWVLGAGTDTLPRLAPHAPEHTSRPDAMGRAEDLASIGLFVEAATAIDAHTPSITKANERAKAAFRSAQLWAKAKRHAEAAKNMEAAASDAELAPMALERAVHAYLQDYRYAEAHRVNEALLELDHLETAEREAAETRASWLTELVEPEHLSIGLSSLDDAWRVDHPMALQTAKDSLRVEALLGGGDLSRVQLTRTQEHIGFRIELDVERQEWASGLAIRLRPVEDIQFDRVGVEIQGTGGGGLVYRQLGCWLPGETELKKGGQRRLNGPGESERLVISADMSLPLRRATCRVEDPDGVVLHEESQALPEQNSPPAGPWELVIASGGDVQIQAVVSAVAGLSAIELQGFRLADEDSADPGRDYVNGDFEPASKGQGVVAAIAAARLGDETRAEQLLREAVPESEVPPNALLDGLRAQPAIAGPLARRVLGERYWSVWSTAWGASIASHEGDELCDRALLEDLEGLRGSRPASAGDLATTRLLNWRGRASLRAGETAGARLDLDLALQRAAAAASLDGGEELRREAAREQGNALVGLAVVALAEEDREGALAMAERARDVIGREGTKYQLLAFPGFAALASVPGWQTLLE